MARIEKTVFISYRRTDVYMALAVYQSLASQGYDVFFDYTSVPSGDFEQIIISNIKARAHFVLILTPTALNRCSEPGDWLRREIETAIDEKRNIIPLFFKEFNFGNPAVTEQLTGQLSTITRYNGLNVHEDYFHEAMQRLIGQFLSVPLDTVLHPVSTEVRKAVKEEQVAADKAVQESKNVQELVKPVEEKIAQLDQAANKEAKISPEAEELARKEVVEKRKRREKVVPTRKGTLLPAAKPIYYVIGSAITLLLIGGILGANYLIRNVLRNASPTPTSENETALGIGSTMISPQDGMTLLYVPEGEFSMGSDEGDDNEKPVHTVHLDAFWIDQTEVTNAMYAMCVNDGDCDLPNSTSSTTHDSYYGNSEFDDYPVIYVSWFQATAYCKWAGRELPTEAEWEKAARGADGRTYPWGDDSPSADLLNYNQTVGDTTEVGKYPNGASMYGALDMAGNVWEWVNDWYSDTYYSSSPSSNPLGPDSGDYRVLRGGSWNFIDSGVRSAFRNWVDPKDTNYYVIGIRCSRSP